MKKKNGRSGSSMIDLGSAVDAMIRSTNRPASMELEIPGDENFKTFIQWMTDRGYATQVDVSDAIRLGTIYDLFIDRFKTHVFDFLDEIMCADAVTFVDEALDFIVYKQTGEWPLHNDKEMDQRNRRIMMARMQEMQDWEAGMEH